MKVYGAKAPWPWLKGLIRENRPVWFLEEAGIPYERISLDPTKGETRGETYTRLNRFQKIPTLDDNGFILTQSAAILDYLGSTTGKLYPQDAREQAKHLEWMFYCMADVEPFAMQIGNLLKVVEESEHVHAAWQVRRAEKLLSRSLDYLGGELEGKRFLMGDTFYAADILLGCCLYAIREHELIAGRPEVNRLLKSYYSRPAFQRMLELNGT